MRVLIVSAVFPPEPVVSAKTSAQIAEQLAQKGHDVEVVTNFPNRPAGKLYPGYRRGLYTRSKTGEGYEIMRCFSTLSPQSSMASRFLENLSIGITAGLAALFMKRADVIYSNMWPVFAAGILSVVARLRRIPIVTSIQDVYPESMAYQGRIQPGDWIYNLLSKADGAIARSSAAVIVLSERTARLYREERRVQGEKIHVVPNWAGDISQADPASGQAIRRRHGIPEEAFLLTYGGNIGYAAGVEDVIRAFKWLQDSKNIYLLIAGSGSRLDACRTLATEVNGERIKFHTPWPEAETGAVYAAADALVLPTREGQALASLPSKLIDYMLAERPILAACTADTDLSDAVLQSGGGWVVEPGHTERLAEKITEIAGMELRERREMGRSAREYALRTMTAESCLPKIIEIIEASASTR